MKTIEEHPCELGRHFYLYSKFWYVKSDNLIADLNKIIDVFYGEEEDRTTEEVYQLVSDVFVKFGSDNDKNKFILQIMDSRYRGNITWDNKPTCEDFIQDILNCFGHTKVEDMPFELGNPDKKILPLVPEAIKKLKKMRVKRALP